MRKQKSIIAVVAVFLAIAIIFSGCTKEKEVSSENTHNGGVNTQQTAADNTQKYTDKSNKIKKTETVYVNLENSGETKNIIVSDWIHTDKAEVAVSDISDLDNIVNVKSNEKPKKKGDSLTWHMGTTDLYYRGESKKELPVTFTIKYFLNDAEMTAEEIAGKSGNVRISIEMQNNISITKKINGKNAKIYSPVLAVGGMILPEGQFQNITVENGKSIGDGTKEFAVMMGFPGLSETLGIETVDLGEMGEISFAQNFNITAAVTDFSLQNIYFGVIPLSALGTDIKIPSSVNELKQSLNKLKELQSIITQIDPQNVLTTLMQNPEKITEIVSIINNAVSLYEENKALIELLPKYMTDENVAALSKLINAENGTSSLQEMITLLSNPVVQRFLKLLPIASQDMLDILPMMQDLATDLQKPEIKNALDNLPHNLERLTKLQGQLKENSELINQLTGILNADNLDKLSGALDSINNEDFTEMLNRYGIIIENSDILLARASEMFKLGNEYKIYSSVAEGMTSSVMFIYQTPSIKAPVIEEPVETAEEISWYQKILNKFKK